MTNAVFELQDPINHLHIYLQQQVMWLKSWFLSILVDSGTILGKNRVSDLEKQKDQ